MVEVIGKRSGTDDKNKTDIGFIHYFTNGLQFHVRESFSLYCLYGVFKSIEAPYKSIDLVGEVHTDIVELLKEKNAGKDILCGDISIHDIERDDISEIYLIFDYDAHHYAQNINRSLAELEELICHFDNETEHGKLYVSYPMIEAINYHHLADREVVKLCYFPYNSGANAQGIHFKKVRNLEIEFIKKLSSNGFTEEEWESIFQHFVHVLYLAKDEAAYTDISPVNLFALQLDLITAKEKILVVSALPALIIEYFGEKFYKSLLSNVDTGKAHVIVDL